VTENFRGVADEEFVLPPRPDLHARSTGQPFGLSAVPSQPQGAAGSEGVASRPDRPGLLQEAGTAREPLDQQLLRSLQEQVADLLTEERSSRKQRGQADLARADEEQRALSFIQQVVRQHMHDELAAGHVLPNAAYDQRLMGAVFAAMYQAGQLQELLEDDQVENIDINGCDEVWVTYADARGKQRGRPVANSDEDLIDLVQNLASYAGLNPRPFSLAHPSLNLRLHDGSRLSALMVASERPSVSIRRNRYPQMFLDKLVELGTIDEQLAAFLRAAVLARHNIMVAGATDAGKTTLLRALINVVPPEERLVVIEQSLELGLRRNNPDLHPDCTEWEEVQADADGKGGVSLDELVRRSKRQNPSRVIMGEILGPEVLEVLNAMSQGNNGSLSTIHARSARDVFDMLTGHAAVYQGVQAQAMQYRITSAIDFVVFAEKNRRLGGRRCVTQVLEVNGLAGDRPATSMLFMPGPDGRAMRDSAVAIARAQDLADAGYRDGTWAFQAPRPGRL